MKHPPFRIPSLLVALLCAVPMIGARAEDESLPARGDRIMEEVRARLPLDPIRLTGFIRTREGRRNIDRALVSDLRFGDRLPHMRFALSDLFGEPLTLVRVSWPQGATRVEQWDGEGNPLPDAAPTDGVADTGLTWSDLSLDFLWWEGAEVTGRERIKTRSSHVVRIPAPPERPDLSAVRLWVDTSALFVVRAELIGPNKQALKRIDVDSIVEIRDGVWMVKDLIIRDHVNNRRMGVRFEDVEEHPGDLDEGIAPEEVSGEVPGASPNR